MSDRGFVLIVDDDAASAKVLQDLMENDGYAVDRVASGKDVAAAITVRGPNLVYWYARMWSDRLKSGKDLN